MSLKVAIVGCGQIADGHIEEIKKLSTGNVVAVCDLELLMAEQIAKRYGIPNYYNNFTELLKKEKPQVVHITTPPQSHLPLALQSMDAGCHVYVEKPFTLNYEDSKKLLEHAEKLNKKVTIGHTYEFDPPALDLLDLVDNGVLGDVIHVESYFGYNLKGSFGSAIFSNTKHWVHGLPGKLFQNNINHLLNKIAVFLPDERPQIKALGFRLRKELYGDLRDEALDELRVMMKGEKVSAYATFTSHVKPVAHFVKVYGTHNTAFADFTSRTVTLEKQPTLPSAIGRVVTGFTQGFEFLRSSSRNVQRFMQSEYHFFSGLNYLISKFYESILQDAPLPIPYRDILRIAAWMDEIFAQLSEGR